MSETMKEREATLQDVPLHLALDELHRELVELTQRVQASHSSQADKKQIEAKIREYSKRIRASSEKLIVDRVEYQKEQKVSWIEALPIQATKKKA